MKATIYYIAKEAGVSIATDSKVINGKGKLAQDTRGGSVLAIMDTIGF